MQDYAQGRKFGNANGQAGAFGASTGFGGFGANNNTTANTTGFGSTNTNTGTGFTGGFGSTNTGGFGSNNNTPAAGGLFGTSLFGQQNNQQPQQTGGLFGASTNNQQTGGGLFGAKPAGATGGGLFGASTTNNTNTTGGGLFGGLGNNNQTQQNQGGGLFGQNNQQQQKPGGLFGSSTTNTGNTGGGLFGGSLNQNNNTGTGLGSSLFGNSQQNQQQQQPQLGGSLFGNSQQQLQQSTNQAPSFTTSMNANPYGNDQLFASLGTPGQSVGPLITPLSSGNKLKKSAILPQQKINPAASSRTITPQKRISGYGFSYSTYGSPASGAPSLSSSTLGGGSFSKSLSKSFSASNLRKTWTADDSILAPGAFQSTRKSFANTGSMKRLQIDKDVQVRNHLFDNDTGSPAFQKKRVSFDAHTALTNGTVNGTVPETDSPTPSAEEQGLLRSPARPHINGVATNGASSQSSAPVVGNELAVVHEDEATPSQSVIESRQNQTDQTPGEYWSKPSLKELKKMGRNELAQIKDFQVGRQGVGKIEFEKPVDLNGIDLDDLFGKVVRLEIRSATVYPSKSNTPAMGKGLNVPSKISLENSWPRAEANPSMYEKSGGRRVAKHIARLQKVGDTEFVSYNPETGVWVFKVEHFTTYGLDYDDDDDDANDSTLLSAPPESPTPNPRARNTPAPLDTMAPRLSQDDSTMVSEPGSSVDDTFDFKRGKKKTVPGSFDDESTMYEDDQAMGGEDQTMNSVQSFLDERSVGPYEEGSELEDSASYHSGSDSAMEQDMAGSFPVLDLTTELPPTIASKESAMPKSILKASQPLRPSAATPRKDLDFDADWAQTLQRTVSPKKQDRQALRASQGAALKRLDEKDEPTPKAVDHKAKPFSTSIDLMNSLFGQSTSRKVASSNALGGKGTGFEWPYQKKPKTGDDLDGMDDADRAFHESYKPHWTVDGTLTYATPGDAPKLQGSLISNLRASMVGQHKDVRFAKFTTPADVSSHANGSPGTLSNPSQIWSASLTAQADGGSTHISAGSVDEPPRAEIQGSIKFSEIADLISVDTPTGKYEQDLWRLASILFENAPVETHGLEPDIVRKAKLGEFWRSIVLSDADRQARQAQLAEERALAHLSANSIAEACDALVDGRNFRLATMVAQIGGSDIMGDVAAQINAWREQNALSEMSDAIRSIYTILSGECAVAEGKSGAGGESRADDVNISSRFGFDWRQAFGLRLWYAIDNDDHIETAVEQFENDLRDHREMTKPRPWYQRTDEKIDWVDPNPEEREDVLWGLLKIYRASKTNEHVDIGAILSPQNITGNPLDARVSWQLLQILRHQNVLPLDKDGGAWDERAITELSDSLTSTLSLPLLTPTHWLHAGWVLLHISKPAVRAEAIKSLLLFNGSRIGDNDSDANFKILTVDLKIAPEWIFAAKATHARSVVQDPVLEVQYLISGRSWSAAHDVLTTAVAPAAVIADNTQDLARLESLLDGFADAGNFEAVEGWNQGGGMYLDYINLLSLDRGYAANESATPADRASLLYRLATALEAVASTLPTRDVVERAACAEMSRKVGEWLDQLNDAIHTDKVKRKNEAQTERQRTLRLPLTEDRFLKHTRELSVGYYRAVIVGRGN
ncbi:hypothetical protein K490DRAFT_37272 [Saccharata proteae CBS 121410]|uniref:Peptidase S59 domain-containing protein n=1 Tax=Saccharata proteae CBS 121410 TaxID=1314787 RepID=A0A6A5YCT8_9PEZI|nr:hypothetical protein K490DRAFT_37272 [Saccharata proteae CBS 121410]